MDQRNDLSEAGKEKAYFCLTECHETLLAADLETDGEDSCHIDAERPGGIFYQLSTIFSARLWSFFPIAIAAGIASCANNFGIFPVSIGFEVFEFGVSFMISVLLL